ncbi:MAG TPA: hypothetical protein VMZ26_06400 [Pyrinomonadaceae bacterium]|nr:hypothetical protein [Pyrinomonadaceae bacterium]
MNLIRLPHSAVIRFGFGAFVLALSLPLISSAQQRLEWEVVNPFHFISDLDAIDELRGEFKTLSDDGNAGHATDTSAHALEVALQRKNERTVKNRRDAAEHECQILPATEREPCLEKTKFPYLGWFSRLARNNHAGTCWDSSALKFRNEGACADYIKSPRHRVRMWVDNPVSTDFFAWKWETGKTDQDPKQCHPKYEHKVCVEFDVETDNEVSARAVSPDGAVLMTTVKVEDVLIAGMGDSFAAGEGNPDIPAQFLERQSDTDFVWFWKFRRSARKDRIDQDVGGLADPAWLDKRCHRSMYSYQFKAALHFALENPKKSVTFASVSCSGAEIPELIDTPQTPKEEMKGATVYQTVGKNKKIKPQIRALEELLAERKTGIDYLLLSIGGNDAGFAKYVAYVMLSGKTLWLATKAKQARVPKIKRVDDAIVKLQEEYKELNHQLGLLRFKPLPGGDTLSKRIILTGYPDFLNDEKGSPCAVNRDEFSMPFNRDGGRGKRLGLLASIVYPRLRDLQENTQQVPWWTLAPADKSKWLQHGFCAQARPLTKDSIQERFIMPKRKNHKWYSIEPRCSPNETGECDEKMPFDPRDYKTYGERSRWIRLPVDSKLSVDQQTIIWLFSLDLFFTDDWSTVMHPTAEGFAVNADATLKAIRALSSAQRQ